MNNFQGTEVSAVNHKLFTLYNKARMIVMLAGFTLVTLIAISHSGNVSDTCRSEWNFIRKGESGELKSKKMKQSIETLNNSSINNPCTDSDISSGANRLPDLDLIFPKLVFAL